MPAGDWQMFYAWRAMGETTEHAEARFRQECPEAAGNPVTVIGWLDG